MKRKCWYCKKEWETDALGGYYTSGNEPICNECNKKEMDEYHRRRIKDLNRDLLETEIIQEILRRLK